MTHFVCSASWIEETSLDQTIEFLTELARVHASESGPYRAQIEKYLDASDWRGLIDFTVDYSVGSPMELYHARQALAFFQKLEALPLGIDKELVAWTKFRETEASCGLTNARLRRADPLEIPEGVASVMLTAQRKISAILGDVPTLSSLKLAYGPGANVGIKSKASSARWKLNDPLRCSANMAALLPRLLEEVPSIVEAHRVAPVPKVVYGSDPTHPAFSWCNTEGLLRRVEDYLDRASVVVEVVDATLSFAEKNAKTYRPICVEPPLNTLFQKGCGAEMRKRFRKAGLDLNTLAERNKKLAQVSSINGRLATVDLSSASDTISREVVAELFPWDWYSLLSTFRSGTVTYKDQSYTLQKFSSMGNGCTFELESILFYSLAYGCAAVLGLDCSDVTSYGDDIIIPVEAVPLLRETFNYLGFTINMEKSFFDGRFRESCGGDYVDGLDIRPYYQKDLVSGQTLFALHNYYVRTLQPEMSALVLKAIHPDLIQWGPDGYGDGHLIGSWEHCAKSTHDDLYNGSCGVIFETFTLKQRHDFRRCQTGDRVLPAYSIYMSEKDHLSYLDGETLPYAEKRHMSTDHFVVRGHKGYKRISIYTFRTDVFVRFD